MIARYSKTKKATRLREWRAKRTSKSPSEWEGKRNKSGPQSTPEGKAAYMRNFGQEWKTRAVMFLGGICNRCGNNDSRVLQLDHVAGGGRQDMKLRGSRNSHQAAKDVFDNPHKYQVLCANCNWIKRFERSETGGYAAGRNKWL